MLFSIMKKKYSPDVFRFTQLLNWGEGAKYLQYRKTGRGSGEGTAPEIERQNS